MDESQREPNLNYEALASMLADTLVSVSGDRSERGFASGTALPYFGDYELEQEIARGGMGIVYRARQRTLNRTVAVKVLRDHIFAGAEEVTRFKTEAAAAASLRHPHIVGIHEIGEHEGTHFFSMDFVDGGTLSQLVREGPLPARKAAEIVLKVARAIHHAHTLGVLHRDLKPANILLDGAGEPLVTDFGLARHVAQEAGLTVTGQVLGTPAYMAPEQAAGRAKECGAPADVYGLGAVLYHVTSGRPPFTGDTHLAVMHQVARDEPVGVRLLNPSVPRDLETVCAKAMAKEPRRRYQTADDMAADLQRFLDGRPVVARPVGIAGRLWRWARRHPALAAALGAVVLLTIGVLVTISVSRARIDGLRADAVRRLYAADMRLAFQNISADRHGAAVPLLTRYADPEGEDLRGFEWDLARALTQGSETVSLASLPGQVAAVAWSPDGQWIVAGADTLHIWKMENGRPGQSQRAGVQTRAVAFSPDSSRVAVSGQAGEVSVFSCGALEQVLFTARFPASPQALGWRVDGKVMEILAPQMHWRWAVGAGEPERVGSFGGIARVAFVSADARRGLILQAGPPGGDAWQVAVRDLEAGVPLATVRTPNMRMPKCMACSADNRWLAIGDFAGRTAVLETPFTERSREFPARRSMVDQVVLSNDGSLMACAADHVIHVYDRATGTLRRIFRGHFAGITSMMFSPDGTALLSGDAAGAVKWWSMAPPAPDYSVPGTGVISSADGSALCWNAADGKVAFRSAGGVVGLINAQEQGKVRGVFHNGIALQSAVAASDGERRVSIHRLDAPVEIFGLPGLLTACSPDGNWLTYSDAKTGEIMLIDRIRKRAPVSLASGWIVSVPVFSADSRWCAVGWPDGRIRVFASDGGKELCSIAAHRRGVRGKAFSADGSLLVTAGFDGHARLWEMPSGKLVREFTGNADTLWSVTLSPDGSRIAAGTGDTAIILWDTASGLETATIRPDVTPGPVDFLTFTADGTALVAEGLFLKAAVRP